MLLLDPETLDIVDSIPAPVGFAFGGGLVRAVHQTVAYVASLGGITCLDVLTLQFECTRTVPWRGPFRPAPEDQWVLSGDAGHFFDSPGSGRIEVYTRLLQLYRTFDVKAPSRPSDPAVMQDLDFRDDRVVVLTGTLSIGPTFGSQRMHIVVLDFLSGETVRTIDLGQYGPGVLIHLPSKSS